VTQRLSVLGVPSSAGAFAPGQELAPAALREAGLLERLRDAGVEVEDLGDSPVWRWRPDREHPRAQNAGAVAETVRQTAARVESALGAGHPLLVLGGDCTIELGTLAGHAARGDRVGLVYFDLHPDLNTPASVPTGTLDWMGMAHALGVPGALPELAETGTRTPLLDPDQVLFFSYGPEQAKPFELEQMERLGLERIAVDAVAADPEGCAERVLGGFGSRFERLLVHFDVDVIDFSDWPVSENAGRGEGLPFDAAIRALGVLLRSEGMSALTVTELNPLHGDEEAREVERFVDALVGCLTG
jgi:arginase